MEKNVEKILNNGETVLWSGTSAPFSLLDSAAGNGRKIITRWIVVVVLAAALLGLYLKNNHSASFTFEGAVLLIALLILVLPVLERRNVLASRYIITNQRAIVLLGSHSVFSMRLDCIDKFRTVRDEAPQPCLVIGSPVFCDIHRQLRWRSCHPLERPSSSEDNNAQGMVFYCIRDAEAAAALLNRLCTSAA